jgi:hypothetical protein
MTPKAFAEWLRKEHRGKEYAIRCTDIIRLWVGFYATNERELRQLAADACFAGFPVLGGARGYFYAKNRAEAEAALARLEGQAKAMLARVSAIKKMLDADGQGTLFETATP